MANYVLTHKAVADLANIWNYTYEAWSEKQADKYYYLLLGACEDLANEKVAGKLYPEIGDQVYGFRISRHIIFYRKTGPQKIEVGRILHSSMDLKNRMKE
jgi:toxin ParE1/3/4